MSGIIAVLAEKFFLVLETLLSRTCHDQPAIVVRHNSPYANQVSGIPGAGSGPELSVDERLSVPAVVP